jgi:hypothetical protein
VLDLDRRLDWLVVGGGGCCRRCGAEPVTVKKSPRQQCPCSVCGQSTETQFSANTQGQSATNYYTIYNQNLIASITTCFKFVDDLSNCWSCQYRFIASKSRNESNFCLFLVLIRIGIGSLSGPETAQVRANLGKASANLLWHESLMTLHHLLGEIGSRTRKRQCLVCKQKK